jgi:hypothetical protein
MYGVHAFDVVVRDETESLAIELKFLRNPKRGNAKANGELQRFLGQCLLATLAHRHVIGLCVAEEKALDWTATSGIDTFTVTATANKPDSGGGKHGTAAIEEKINLIIRKVA